MSFLTFLGSRNPFLHLKLPFSYYTVLYCTALYCNALHSELYCTVYIIKLLIIGVLYVFSYVFGVKESISELKITILLLYCTVLCCTALYYVYFGVTTIQALVKHGNMGLCLPHYSTCGGLGNYSDLAGG